MPSENIECNAGMMILIINIKRYWLILGYKKMETEIVIKDNIITLDEYLHIRKMVGWKTLSDTQAQKALDNSIYHLGAYEDDKLIGMGRIVGDGAVICYIQDLIVLPEYQGKGIGSKILSKLISYVKIIGEENTEMMLCLMCAKGRERFYEKHGFIARPTDSFGPGMIQYLELLD